MFDHVNNVYHYVQLAAEGEYATLCDTIRFAHNFVATVTECARNLDNLMRRPEASGLEKNHIQGLINICQQILDRAVRIHLHAQEQAIFEKQSGGIGIVSRPDLAREERAWADQAPRSWTFLRNYHLIQSSVYEHGRPPRRLTLPWEVQDENGKFQRNKFAKHS